MERRSWKYIVGRPPDHEAGELEKRYESMKVIPDGDSLWVLDHWMCKENAMMKEHSQRDHRSHFQFSPSRLTHFL